MEGETLIRLAEGGQTIRHPNHFTIYLARGESREEARVSRGCHVVQCGDVASRKHILNVVGAKRRRCALPCLLRSQNRQGSEGHEQRLSQNAAHLIIDDPCFEVLHPVGGELRAPTAIGGAQRVPYNTRHHGGRAVAAGPNLGQGERLVRGPCWFRGRCEEEVKMRMPLIILSSEQLVYLGALQSTVPPPSLH